MTLPLAILLAAAAAAAPPPKAVLLKAAHLFDSRSGKLVSPGLVLVEGTLITAVGGEVQPPADAQIVDLGDATLLPGFLDAHTHLSGEGTDSYYEDEFQRRMRPPAEQAHHAAVYARRTLEAGFTTVRDLGSNDYIDMGLHHAI